MTIKLTSRERDTILAALRFWQLRGAHAPAEIQDIADNGDLGTRLDINEIDDLCMGLNTTETA